MCMRCVTAHTHYSLKDSHDCQTLLTFPREMWDASMCRQRAARKPIPQITQTNKIYSPDHLQAQYKPCNPPMSAVRGLRRENPGSMDNKEKEFCIHINMV
jgi:hypothetical protein